MSGSNCCFLTCIQISQEAGQVVWYSHLLKNFSQFVVIHTVKGFGTVSKAEVDVFLELSCFFHHVVPPSSKDEALARYSVSRDTYAQRLAFRASLKLLVASSGWSFSAGPC